MASSVSVLTLLTHYSYNLSLLKHQTAQYLKPIRFRAILCFCVPLFSLFLITVFARRLHCRSLGGGIAPPDAARIDSVKVFFFQRSAVFAVPHWLDGMESMWPLMEMRSKSVNAALVRLCRSLNEEVLSLFKLHEENFCSWNEHVVCAVVSL